MILNPFRKDSAHNVEADTVVYTAFLESPEFSTPLLWGAAHTSKEELKEHCFWFGGGFAKPPKGDVQVIELTADEYVKRHLKECEPMNPFYSLGRIEFLLEWRKKSEK